ncbi:hypothetical protein CerSpe_239630 [Prunus speciosa]
MRDVNQRTGKDLLPLEKKSSEGDGLRTNPLVSMDRPVTRIGISGIRIEEEDDVFAPSRRQPSKRMSSPEKWEAQQLIASGVLSVTEYPMYDEEKANGMLYQEEGAEEETEVETREDKPGFLEYSLDMSPVKILKNPKGSLSRTTALRSALAKEDREVSLGRSNARGW